MFAKQQLALETGRQESARLLKLLCVVDTRKHLGTPNYGKGYPLFLEDPYGLHEIPEGVMGVFETDNPRVPHIRIKLTRKFMEMCERHQIPTNQEYLEVLTTADGLFPEVRCVINVPFDLKLGGLKYPTEQKLAALSGANFNTVKLVLTHPEELDLEKDEILLICHNSGIIAFYENKALLNAPGYPIVELNWLCYGRTALPLSWSPVVGMDELAKLIGQRKIHAHVTDTIKEDDEGISVNIELGASFFDADAVPYMGGLCMRPLLRDCQQLETYHDLLEVRKALMAETGAE